MTPVCFWYSSGNSRNNIFKKVTAKKKVELSFNPLLYNNIKTQSNLLH